MERGGTYMLLIGHSSQGAQAEHGDLAALAEICDDRSVQGPKVRLSGLHKCRTDVPCEQLVESIGGLRKAKS